jgi:flagellar biosynthesis component FlhA
MSLKKILKEDFENKDQLYVIKLDNYIAELEILSNNLKKGKEKYQKDLFDNNKNVKNQYEELLEMYKKVSMFNITSKHIELKMKDSITYLRTKK